jgi:hypothetical protein
VGDLLAACARSTGQISTPAPHRFIGDLEPTLGQQFLDVSVAEGEAEIQPDRVLDDLRREAMTAVGERSHPDILPGTPLSRPRFRDNAAAAVGSDGDGTFVDTITDNRVTRLAIKTGLTDNGRIEVTTGLAEATPVVTTVKGAPAPGTAVQPLTVNENS